jgi:hypothetical protein
VSSDKLGSVKRGTVGRLASGRLVLVERVTPFAAYLVSLPEQHDEFVEVDGRFFGPMYTICTSPFITIYTVDATTLSVNNREFLYGYGLSTEGLPEWEEPVNEEDLLDEIAMIKAELEKLAKQGA